MTGLAQRPVRRGFAVAYPTRLEVLADPALLREHIPASWLSKKELAGVLGVLMAFNAGGCSKDRPSGTSTRPAGNDLAGKAAIVAPVFEHGEGRGASGCVMVNPPVFLSEEEALQAITEELAQTGLRFSERKVRVEGVSIPARQMALEQDWVTGKPKLNPVVIPGRSNPLEVDLKDPVHQIAVEFVSENDYIALGGPNSMSSVQSYEFKEVANWVGKQVQEQGHGVRMAVFYDPKAGRDLSESKRLLRLQVKDFIDWLKGQGVI
jgi:hypothetical protein